jgi:hypothetical protein
MKLMPMKFIISMDKKFAMIEFKGDGIHLKKMRLR